MPPAVYAQGDGAEGGEGQGEGEGSEEEEHEATFQRLNDLFTKRNEGLKKVADAKAEAEAEIGVLPKENKIKGNSNSKKSSSSGSSADGQREGGIAAVARDLQAIQLETQVETQVHVQVQVDLEGKDGSGSGSTVYEAYEAMKLSETLSEGHIGIGYGGESLPPTPPSFLQTSFKSAHSMFHGTEPVLTNWAGSFQVSSSCSCVIVYLMYPLRMIRSRQECRGCTSHIKLAKQPIPIYQSHLTYYSHPYFAAPFIFSFSSQSSCLC